MKTVEIGGRERCPCESGLSYARCCKRKAFTWERDKNGRIVRSHKMGKETAELVDEVLDEFSSIFGRRPGKEDPVFFEQYYMSTRDFERQTLDIMRQTNSPPSLIYAFMKTGRIVANPKALTKGELEEWNAAIDEFYDAVDNGADPDELVAEDELSSFLRESVRRNQIVSGSFVSRHFNNYRKRPGANDDLESICGFTTANFTRLLKSIHILLGDGSEMDAYYLLRGLYENYLVTSYVCSFPSEATVFLAQMGVAAGTHAYARSRRGTPIQSEIVEIASGMTHKVPSRWEMANKLGGMDVSVYNEAYKPMSSFVHSELNNIRSVLSEGGYQHHSSDVTVEVCLLCNLLCMLFYNCLHNHSSCIKILKHDLEINSGRSLFALRMTETVLTAHEITLPAMYRAAIAHVIARNPRLATLNSVSDRAAATYQAGDPTPPTR
jgi:hypothetical protein